MPNPESDSRTIESAIDLAKTPLHLGPLVGGQNAAVRLRDFEFDGPSFEKYIADHCRDGEPGRIIMVESTPSDWPAWECHTQGDEIVIILEGDADFIQEIDGGERHIAVRAGSAIINPMGVWHTANVRSPLKAVYITPCPGTESRPR